MDEESSSFATPVEHASTLARLKAEDVAGRHRNRWVLGADTIVVLDEEILGKPVDEDAARGMLVRLSGRWHEVVTGYCLCPPGGGPPVVEACRTRVRFRELTDGDIRWYLATGEPRDKAGGYGIQGRGAFLVKELSGSYSNVVGLPVCEVVELLRNQGALVRTHEDRQAG